jgi:hypothetical protein
MPESRSDSAVNRCDRRPSRNVLLPLGLNLQLSGQTGTCRFSARNSMGLEGIEWVIMRRLGDFASSCGACKEYASTVPRETAA